MGSTSYNPLVFFRMLNTFYTCSKFKCIWPWLVPSLQIFQHFRSFEVELYITLSCNRLSPLIYFSLVLISYSLHLLVFIHFLCASKKSTAVGRHLECAIMFATEQEFCTYIRRQDYMLWTLRSAATLIRSQSHSLNQISSPSIGLENTHLDEMTKVRAVSITSARNGSTKWPVIKSNCQQRFKCLLLAD